MIDAERIRNLIISIKHIAQKLVYLPYQRATVSFLGQQFTVSINSIITNHRSWRTNRRGKNTTPPSTSLFELDGRNSLPRQPSPPTRNSSIEIVISDRSSFIDPRIYR